MTKSSLPVPQSHVPDESWRAEAGAMLRPGETVLAGLELDLDARLHFTQGWLVVTDQRLLARSPGEKSVREWVIETGLRLSHTDHAGVARWNWAMLRAGLQAGAIRLVTIPPRCGWSTSSRRAAMPPLPRHHKMPTK